MSEGANLLAGLVEPGRVHRRLYTDPTIFEQEQTRVFAASWCFLAHESQLPGAGDYLTTTVGGRPIVVVRGADGEIRAVLNRCRHRGAIVVADGAGCARRFTCPYHGWTYADDGRLVALPFGQDHPGDRRELGLGRLAVETYRGFVFGTLHPDPESVATWLGTAASWFDVLVDRHPGGTLRVAPTPQRVEFAGNWKLSWDNAADGLHATFAHRSYNELAEARDVDTVLERDAASTPMTAHALASGHMVVDQRPGIPQGPWATMRPLPFTEPLVAALSRRVAADTVDLAAGSMVNLSLFPSLIFVGNQLLVVEPVAVDRTRLTMHLVLAPDAPREVDLLRLRVEEDFVSFGTPDDLDMFERVQRGLGIPELEWIDVSRGLGTDDVRDDGTIVGPISSDAPMRSYLAHYAKLMSTEVMTRAR
ncbi:MAG: aromatic ring-hydroxylating dioxygenase subunit alpha [Ilumatobacteraceae bacterium]